MINFYISQMAALVLEEHLKLSGLIKSQIASAPVKADIWRLRCEKDELLTLRDELSAVCSKVSEKPYLELVLKEINEICAKHT